MNSVKVEQLMQSLTVRREIARKEGELLRNRAEDTLKRIEQIHEQMSWIVNSEKPEMLKNKE